MISIRFTEYITNKEDLYEFQKKNFIKSKKIYQENIQNNEHSIEKSVSNTQGNINAIL